MKQGAGGWIRDYAGVGSVNLPSHHHATMLKNTVRAQKKTKTVFICSVAKCSMRNYSQNQKAGSWGQAGAVLSLCCYN